MSVEQSVRVAPGAPWPLSRESADERYRLLVESVEDYAIMLLDPVGNVLTWNVGAERICGYAAAEIIGRHSSVFYPEPVRRAGKCEYELGTATLQGRFEDDGWRVRKDGARFWANVVFTALHDSSGNHIGFANVTRDLTERRRAEEALRQSEERFRLMVDNVSDYAIFMLDASGNVVTWNSGAERITGYTAQAIIAQHFSRFFPKEDVEAGKCSRQLAIATQLGRYEDEGFRLRKDGSRFWANVVLNVMRDPQGRVLGFAKVIRDLTQRRMAEEERILLAQAQEANRVKDEFLATVSHELRTPLNAILGWAAMLTPERLTDLATVERGLEVIRRNARAQAKIIEDILDVSRIMTGKLKLESQPINLADVVRDAIEVVRPSLELKRLELVIARCDDAVELEGDAGRLLQVVWNLLSNAVKFTDSPGRVTVAVERSRSGAVVSVSDTGRGLSVELLPHVFEPFRQADSSSARRFGGLGLGLAIVRHLVELHGGTVFARSEGEGKGACFGFELPIRGAPSLRPSDVELTYAGGTPSTERLKGARLLIVDDHADARELLAELLESHGAVVHQASSAQEAFELFQSVQPDLLLSDIGMPNQDGHELIRWIRELPGQADRRTPALALTAYARREDRSRALRAGYDCHLAKPIEPARVLAAVVDLLGI